MMTLLDRASLRCIGLIGFLGITLVTHGCGESASSTPAPDAQVVDSMQTAICGNGRVEGGEECDDGNTDDTDTCLSSCERALRFIVG